MKAITTAGLLLCGALASFAGTITGKMVDVQDRPANVILDLRLSRRAKLVATGKHARRHIQCTTASNGQLSCTVPFNDELAPRGTTYQVRWLSSNGTPLSGPPERWFLANHHVDLNQGYPNYLDKKGR